jgi:hypothetical protein
MEFKEFKKKLQDHFAQLAEDADYLFEVDVNKEVLWNLYLDSFPKGTNEIFRQRREFDCSCCKNFIRNIGSAVFIKDNNVITIWDFETGDTTFQPVINALANYIKSRLVADVYISKFKPGCAVGLSPALICRGPDDPIRQNHIAHLELGKQHIPGFHQPAASPKSCRAIVITSLI